MYYCFYIAGKFHVINNTQYRMLSYREAAHYNAHRFSLLKLFGVNKTFGNLFWEEESSEWFEGILAEVLKEEEERENGN